MVLTNLLIFLGLCALLILSGYLLVKTLSKIAVFLKLSEFIIAFIIMAFATSIPELFVGISSAISKNPALSLGNVIGSNIVDLTFIIGIAVILARGIKINKEVRKDSLYMFLIALIPIILMLIGNGLSRIDGVVLVSIFGFYSWNVLVNRRRFKKTLENNIKKLDIILSTVLFLFSLVLLFYSAKYIVKYATLLSIELALPPIIIGLFLLAIGTSLPELVFETSAVLHKHSELALGDVIGSVVVNSTLVLGVTALIYPITANFILFFSSAVFMAVATFLFLTFVYSGNKLDWREGISLIVIYILFIITELYIKTTGGFS